MAALPGRTGDGRFTGEQAALRRVATLVARSAPPEDVFAAVIAIAIANAQARVELRGFAEEQAALRRVATLVARAAPPAQVLAAVTKEAGRLLHADQSAMNRYGPDGTRTVAAWSSTGAAASPIGARAMLGGLNVATLVSQTGRAARIDDYADASGPAADAVRELGLRAAVGVPVRVEGCLWGFMVVGSLRGPLPADTEARLAGFTELAATAIANAEAQAALLRAESERRMLETELQQAERLQTVGQLTSSIAHDFSNLLAVIVGYTEMALDVTDVGDPELHRILDDIRGAADRAVHLSGDLLRFSRRVQANTEKLDLNSLIASMMDLLIMSMSGRAEVIFEPSPVLPSVRADRGQLEQVLLNLAVNARDAMPEGGTLTIRTSTADLSADSSRLHPGTKPARYAELAVQDTGIGMTTAIREKIFERFFTTKPGTGTGLGLSTVHGIITDAGGTIEAHSREGRGTTFHVFLPAAPG
jgi:signal transduction histidine kinase